MTEEKIMGYTVEAELRSDGYGSLYKVSKGNGADVKLLRVLVLPDEERYQEIQSTQGGKSSKTDAYLAKKVKETENELSSVKALTHSAHGALAEYCGHKFVRTDDRRYRLYLLSEYATPLAEYMKKKTLTVREVIAVGKAVAAGLKVCHDEKYLLRRVCENTVFVDENGAFKLGGLEIVETLKVACAEQTEKERRDVAPELYLGKRFDFSVDIYSLGMLLYRLLNRSRSPLMPNFSFPYTQEDETIAFERRLNGAIPPLPLGAENKLGEVVRKAVMPRAERYNNVTEFLQALEDAEKILTTEYLDTPIDALDENTPKNVIMELPITEALPTSEETNRDVLPSAAEVDAPIGIPEKDRKWTRSRLKTLAMCVLPVLTVALLVWFYVGLTPQWYGASVTVADWLTADVDGIVADAARAHPEYSFIGGKDQTIFLIVLQYVLWGAFFVSVFLMIRRLRRRKLRIAPEAVYRGREPYFNLVGVCVKFEKTRVEELEPIVTLVRDAAESLRTTNFGECSDEKVLAAETEIGRAIDALSEAAEKCLAENTRENRTALSEAAQTVTTKISQRKHLSK